MTFKRILLARRRIDPWILAFAMFSVALYLPTAVAMCALFGATGIYVALSNQRRLRAYLGSPLGVIFLYIFWVVLLLGVRGEWQLDNRQLGFMGLLLGFSFIASGLCLVRQPLRWLVLGGRVGTWVALVAALFASLSFQTAADRYDGGGNAAIVALLVALAGIVATIPVEKPWRYLPNGPFYLLIAIVPVFLSQTRAVVLILPVLFLVEFAICSLKWRPRWRNRAYAAAALGLAALFMAPPVHSMLIDRFATVYEYYVDGDQAHNMDSGNIRLALWKASAIVIKEHPLAGVGLRDTFANLERVAGPDLHYIAGGKHVHNFLLQELLANGFLGLGLLLTIFASVLWMVWRQPDHYPLKRCVVYFYGTVLAFGMLHDPFYHEQCMATSMLFLAVLIVQFRRWNLLTPAARRVI